MYVAVSLTVVFFWHSHTTKYLQLMSSPTTYMGQPETLAAQLKHGEEIHVSFTNSCLPNIQIAHTGTIHLLFNPLSRHYDALMITFPQTIPPPMFFLQVPRSPQDSFSVYHLQRRLAHTNPLHHFRRPRKGVSTIAVVYDYPALIVLFFKIYLSRYEVASSTKQFCFLHFQRFPPPLRGEYWICYSVLPTYCLVLSFMCSLCFNACLTAGCERQVLSSVLCLCIFSCLAAGLDGHIRARLYFRRT